MMQDKPKEPSTETNKVRTAAVNEDIIFDADTPLESMY